MSIAKDVRPKCSDCGTTDCHVVAVRDSAFTGKVLRHVFLCGSCEYLRENPEALRAVKLPRERSKRVQKETLFPV